MIQRDKERLNETISVESWNKIETKCNNCGYRNRNMWRGREKKERGRERERRRSKGEEEKENEKMEYVFE